MSSTLEDLKIAVSERNQTEIRELLNKIAKEGKSSTFDSNVNVDYIIRDILRYTPEIDYLDKIVCLLEMVKAPGIFFNDILKFTDDSKSIVPALMLIFELKCRFEIEYEDFYIKLENSITTYHVEFEGYLIFIVTSLKDPHIPEKNVIPIIEKLVSMSLESKSSICVKILYTILVILRMHPGCFKIVNGLDALYIFLESLEPISAIARRIFVEAENSECRPKTVFLQNFRFPEL